jgi:gamma-glutamyltranspeptidase/glutathione hydrolase
VSFGIPDSHAEDADTVLLCVADNAENVVSFINSRFSGFENGIVVGDTGIALQNRERRFARYQPSKQPRTGQAAAHHHSGHYRPTVASA